MTTCVISIRKTTVELDFINALETKVREQLSAQRVGYFLRAGSSYHDGTGYPLALEFWDRIKNLITDTTRRKELQDKLDKGATGIEHALDLLDDGSPVERSHRHFADWPLRLAISLQ
jgi:hypothetical protein